MREPVQAKSPLLKHAGKHVQDTDGKVYQVTGSGSLKRL
jgi:hypothetical protein